MVEYRFSVSFLLSFILMCYKALVFKYVCEFSLLVVFFLVVFLEGVGYEGEFVSFKFERESIYNES